MLKMMTKSMKDKSKSKMKNRDFKNCNIKKSVSNEIKIEKNVVS